MSEPICIRSLRDLDALMESLGFMWHMVRLMDACHVAIDKGMPHQLANSLHPVEHVAFALAALEAKGVAYTLEPGWDGEARG